MATPAPSGTPIVDMIVGANGAGGQKRFYSGRSDGLFNPAENFGARPDLWAQDCGSRQATATSTWSRQCVASGTLGSGTNIVYVNRDGTPRSLFDDEMRSTARRTTGRPAS